MCVAVYIERRRLEEEAVAMREEEAVAMREEGERGERDAVEREGTGLAQREPGLGRRRLLQTDQPQETLLTAGELVRVTLLQMYVHDVSAHRNPYIFYI